MPSHHERHETSALCLARATLLHAVLWCLHFLEMLSHHRHGAFLCTLECTCTALRASHPCVVVVLALTHTQIKPGRGPSCRTLYNRSTPHHVCSHSARPGCTPAQALETAIQDCTNTIASIQESFQEEVHRVKREEGAVGVQGYGDYNAV